MTSSAYSAIDVVSAVEDTLRARRTSKVLGALSAADSDDTRWTREHADAFRSMLHAAAWAPFHRSAHEARHRAGALRSPVPWRFHVLEQAACGALVATLASRAADNPDSKWSRAWQSKIRQLLLGCAVLVQVTWLPDPDEFESSDEREAAQREPRLTQRNIEHIAAASAAVQNLLLAATARDWKSYWSSGGILRDPELFDLIGIPRQEALLGSIFLTPEVAPDAKELPGGLREERGELADWVRWV